MATRKRARTSSGQFQGDDASTPAVNEAWVNVAPDQPVTVDTLASFVGSQKPDRDRMAQALELAREAAEAFTGKPVPEQMSHPMRQGVQLLASRLLLTGQLDSPVPLDEIPLVVRYYWRLAGAGR